jgi:AraC-like DNA-binding protein
LYLQVLIFDLVGKEVQQMSTLMMEKRGQSEGFSRPFLPGMPEYMPEYIPEYKDRAEVQPAQSMEFVRKHVHGDEAGPLRRLCECIDANLLQPDLSPDVIAQRLGMSRATLYRVAHPLGGIQCYVRKRRLEYAFAFIKTNAAAVRSISALAYDLGFGSENTFRRAFKDMFGVSPSDARAKALA